MKYSIKGIIFLVALILLPATIITMGLLNKIRKKKKYSQTAEIQPETVTQVEVIEKKESKTEVIEVEAEEVNNGQ
jgi:hypothetical protein